MPPWLAQQCQVCSRLPEPALRRAEKEPEAPEPRSSAHPAPSLSPHPLLRVSLSHSFLVDDTSHCIHVTPIQDDLTSRSFSKLHLQRPYFQNRSCSWKYQLDLGVCLRNRGVKLLR